MSAQTKGQYPAWLWILVGLAALSGIANSCNQQPSGGSSSFTPSSNQEDFGYRYAKERVKLEGYRDR